MKTKIIEASEPTNSWWGKFMLARFDSEWTRPALISNGEPGARSPLLSTLGWGPEHLWVHDLSVGHAVLLRPGGNPVADLEKHAVYFCPLMVPFLEWLYSYYPSHVMNLHLFPGRVQVRTPKEGWLGPRTGLPDYSKV